MFRLLILKVNFILKLVSYKIRSSSSSATALMNTLDSSFEKVISSKKVDHEKNDKSESDSDSDKDESDKKKSKISSQIVLGVLPGLGDYNTDSSSSEESSDDEEEELKKSEKLL